MPTTQRPSRRDKGVVRGEGNNIKGPYFCVKRHVQKQIIYSVRQGFLTQSVCSTYFLHARWPRPEVTLCEWEDVKIQEQYLLKQKCIFFFFNETFQTCFLKLRGIAFFFERVDGWWGNANLDSSQQSRTRWHWWWVILFHLTQHDAHGKGVVNVDVILKIGPSKIPNEGWWMMNSFMFVFLRGKRHWVQNTFLFPVRDLLT